MPSSRHGFAAALMVFILALFGTVYAATLYEARLPSEASGVMVLIFPPTTSEASAVNSITAAGGRPISSGPLNLFWNVYGDEAGFVRRVEKNGALFALRNVPAGPSLAGCFLLIAPLSNTVMFRF